MIDWNELQTDFNTLLTKTGKINSRCLKTKGLDFKKKYSFYSEFDFRIIQELITLKSITIPNCPKEGCNQSVRILGRKLSKYCESHTYEDRTPWNKGITAKDHPGMQRVSEALKERQKDKCWDNMSDAERATIIKMSEINRNRDFDPNQFEKARKTNMERYGVPSMLCKVYGKGQEAILEKYGSWFVKTERYKQQREEINEKIRKTCLEKYGVDWATKDENIKKKRRKSSAGPSSKAESRSIKRLQSKIPEVFTQYSSENYPFKADIYIPSRDLFIELNYFPSHGNAPYKQGDPYPKTYKKLKTDEEKAEYYATWKLRDPYKRKIAKENNLNWMEFFTEKEFNIWVDSLEEDEYTSPKISFSLLENTTNCLDLFDKMKAHRRSYDSRIKLKQLLVPFIYQELYKKELRLLQDPIKEKEIIQNRVLYLKKLPDQLTPYEILEGFSKSMIHRGYSTFSPLVIRAFIRDYSPNSIYDPFGGWGSRMLGVENLRYHYNDSNKNLENGIKKMTEFYKLENKTFSFKRAEDYMPEKFDAVFTCPPYFNLEDYQHEDDSSKVFPNYKNWINIWWRKVVRNCSNISIFAYVIKESFAKDMNDVLIEEGFVLSDTHTVTKSIRTHLNTSAKETLYIFRKLF